MLNIEHKKMKQKYRKILLDDLLDRTEPFATFHDAYLHKINIDYNARELIAELDIWIGNPDGETKGKGTGTAGVF